MSYYARLHNLGSVRIPEEDARPECTVTHSVSIGGLLDCVVSCDGPLRCCMPLEVMSRLTGDRASDTLRRRILHRGIDCLLDDALSDLCVRVTALVQRAACKCSDACWCCELPANVLVMPFYILVVELRQNVHTLRNGLCILYSCTVSTTTPTLSLLLLLYICMYTTTVCVCVCVCVCMLYSCFTPDLCLCVYIYIYIYD
jgi:hypothetical protein